MDVDLPPSVLRTVNLLHIRGQPVLWFGTSCGKVHCN